MWASCMILGTEDGWSARKCSEDFKRWVSCVKPRLLCLHRPLLLPGDIRQTLTYCFVKWWNYKTKAPRSCSWNMTSSIASVPVHFYHSGVPLDWERFRTNKNAHQCGGGQTSRLWLSNQLKDLPETRLQHHSSSATRIWEFSHLCSRFEQVQPPLLVWLGGPY